MGKNSYNEVFKGLMEENIDLKIQINKMRDALSYIASLESSTKNDWGAEFSKVARIVLNEVKSRSK